MFYSDDNLEVTLTLGGSEVKITRARLGQWLLLEQIRRKPIGPEVVRSYLKNSGLPPVGSGLELLRAYIELLKLNAPMMDFPMLHGEGKSSREKVIPWEYDNRWAITWIHMIVKAYGWTRAEVLGLQLEEAFAYLQEVMVDEQLEKEFQHGLSEVAYAFDKTSNTSKLVPLHRPIWMNGPVSRISKKRKTIPAMWRPSGVIISQEDFAKQLSKRPSFS